MPRTLSGLRTGEFDTIDVSDSINTQNLQTTGLFSHTGSVPAQFDKMSVGPADSTDTNLVVTGAVSCGGLTTAGLASSVKFQNVGSAATAAQTYDGGADRTIEFAKLTLSKGGQTLGPYSVLGADQTLTIPETSIPAFPVSYHASLTNASVQSFSVDETATLISSGFGLTLTPSASTSYLVEVQCWCENDTSNSETLTLTLTQSKTSAAAAHDSSAVFEGKGSKALVVYRKVLALSAGTHQIGLAFNTEDDDNGDNCLVYYGGEYPDVVMTAQPL
jgi:hypothetical protein